MRALASVTHRVTRRSGLDPRSKILLLLLVSSIIMTPTGIAFVPAGIIVGLALAATERAWTRIASITISATVLYLLGWVLPLVWPNAISLTFAVASSYFIRFVVVLGVGAHLTASTSPTQLGAALRSWRLPRALSVTLAVMLRFFPEVVAESRAVYDAMRLRGLTGVAGLVRHPILSVERFIIPMIAASLRASEDLSASAILRGLGSRRTPVALNPPRFGWADLILVLGLTVLAIASLVLPNPLTVVFA